MIDFSVERERERERERLFDAWLCCEIRWLMLTNYYMVFNIYMTKMFRLSYGINSRFFFYWTFPFFIAQISKCGIFNKIMEKCMWIKRENNDLKRKVLGF